MPDIEEIEDNIIKPVRVEPALAPYIEDPNMPDNGNVWLVEVDNEGNEIPDTLTSVSPRMYNLYYSIPQFKVKKKVK